MNPTAIPPSPVELNLLLEWPSQRTTGQWAAIFAVSIGLHIIAFSIAREIPSLISVTRLPEREVVVHRIPLYLPRDLMTQKAPNTRQAAKQIDLADLDAVRQSRKGAPSRPSTRHYEIPKPSPPQTLAQNKPQILPQAPDVKTEANAQPNPGLPSGLPPAAAPAPEGKPSPFQDIGSSAPLNPNPKLFPPKGGAAGAIENAQRPNSDHFAIRDDAPARPTLGGLGTLEQAPAQHSAVELESDPNGADFKAYLRIILSIVRTNWRRVVPESARMGAVRGKTVIEFIISRDGSIPKLVTADSSGSDSLDRAAVAGLSMSNPLPPLPSDFKGNQVRLAFTFAYNVPTR